MKKELQEKIFNDFPKLYRQRKLSMSQTCMCWGITCGDGWYDLIYELSEKIEAIINKELLVSDHQICFCGHGLEKHHARKKCTHVDKIPYSVGANWFQVPKSKILYFLLKVRQKYYNIINTIFSFISPMFNTKLPCPCENYERYHLSASQVKEKFGTLRFYVDGWTDEVEDLIDKAERKSAVTCELCGKLGKIDNSSYWVRTLCEDCKNKDDEDDK